MASGPHISEVATGVDRPAASRSWWARLQADIGIVRWVLVAIGSVVFVLLAAGRLSPFESLIAFGVLAAATIGSAAAQGERAEGKRQAAAPRVRQRPSFEQIIGAWPQPVILVDDRLTIRIVNDAAGDLMGIRRLGDPLSFRLRDPDVLADVQDTLDDGTASTRTIVEKVPSERVLRLHIRPFLYTGSSDMPHPSGKPGGGPARFALIVIEDDTTTYRSERMRSDFVANASHELRTPLASITGCIETLKGPARNDPAGQERFLSIMSQQADRMTALIDDLLSLNRIELRSHRLPQDTVDMETTVAEAVDLARPSADRSGVTLNILEATMPATVRGDASELRQVVINLLQNAIKYGASGEQVDVMLRDAVEGGQRMIELQVRDYGPGIAREHLPRLTERFYRAHEDSNPLATGTGLGLAIVKHIVARHRGRLIIESDLGEGATFNVRLPYMNAHRDSVNSEENMSKNQTLGVSHD